MNKRELLATAALAGMVPRPSAAAADGAARGPGLLTIAGAVDKPNRGAVDPAFDLLMVRHGVAFTRARVLDGAALAALPSTTIRPTLEFDAKVHSLSGPLLSSVLDAAGAGAVSTMRLGLRGVDGYNVELGLAQARSYGMIIATHLDGQPLALGGLGPQWAVFDADRLPAFSDKPLGERFGLCTWALYLIDVRPATHFARAGSARPATSAPARGRLARLE